MLVKVNGNMNGKPTAIRLNPELIAAVYAEDATSPDGFDTHIAVDMAGGVTWRFPGTIEEVLKMLGFT